MPVINKKPIREKPVPYKSEVKEHNSKFYGSLSWKNLRNTYLSLHPLCEFCLANNHIEPATCIHHAVPFERGKTEEEKWSLFLDEHNLISACTSCHIGIHKKDKQYHLERLDNLTNTEWKNIHDKELLS